MVVVPALERASAPVLASQWPKLMQIKAQGSPDGYFVWHPAFASLRGGPRVRKAMGAIGAIFQPELIELMKAVLDDAAAMLPEAKRTSTMKAEIASHILAYAAKGERNPTALKIAALSAVVECTHYSHDISLERRVV